MEEKILSGQSNRFLKETKVPDVVAELGTMKDGGILPDSYPESAEPDDDFLMLSDAKVSDGDRVLLIWTDAEEIVVIGKVEGDEEDAG